ncbi:galactosyltransferase [Nitzschia inconspicua]|uniref:Galactosyltransferase n=1 Tax=Nitzschia inconspicua TaxID=303405 RepID=A0A9K3M3T9_9STRA|nr:galactosyltransferase [Nitzschia inconspicua]
MKTRRHHIHHPSPLPKGLLQSTTTTTTTTSSCAAAVTTSSDYLSGYGWWRFMASDRRLMQVLLLISIFFGANILYLWRNYQYDHYQYLHQYHHLQQQQQHHQHQHQHSSKTVQSDTVSSNHEHDLSTALTPPIHLQSQLPMMVDYDTIFCRNNNNNNVTKKDPKSNQRRRPVFLWGIPSTTSDKEIDRRRLLRNTYLNYYREQRIQQSLWSTKLNNNDNSNDINSTKIDVIDFHPDRICSLHEYTCQHDRYRNSCQLVYVFFVGGGNTTAPTELLDESNTSTITDFRRMLVPTSIVPKRPSPPPQPATTTTNNNNNNNNLKKDTKKVQEPATVSSSSSNTSLPTHIQVDLYEPGVVYLNIRENQFDGKMTTWFQFASLVGNEFPQLDYAAKVDSDLLLFTPNFLHFMQQQQQQQSQQQSQQHTTTSTSTTIQRTYGGVEFPAINCLINQTWDHPCPLPLVGRSYMSGELNFMSMDLAAYIASPHCPHASLTIPHEDVSLSNYVYSYLNNTKYWQYQQQHQDEEQDHSIHIVSFNTSRILLTTSMTANWDNVNLRDNGTLDDMLWGHSIQRGEYKRFLIFKKDGTFRSVWERFVKYKLGIAWPDRRKAGAAGSNNNNNNHGINKDEQLKTVRQQLAEKMKRQQKRSSNNNNRIRRP